MKKKALIKDFRMEIRKSLGRFLSIFFIVALGVSLFSGIRATEPDMRLSGDAYVDENKLMDIRIISTLGLTAKDVEAIRELSTIETAEGAYSVDVLCKVKENMSVLHVMSYLDNMNTITVEEGRLPVERDECLVDHDFLKTSGYKIGDTIVLESGTPASLTTTLEKTEYRIVGSGTSPLYFSLDRGNSMIGNGSVGGFLIVRPEAFVLDVYTEIFALVSGAKKEVAFTDKYDKVVQNAIRQIKTIQDARCEERKEEILESVIQDLIASGKYMEGMTDEMFSIETPEWYIFDRSSIPEYTGYGDNTDRIAALAVVFPSLFFLVAALISLTTMTRMVEEQRLQIGTLKALGYTNLAIAGKYVMYAFLATIGGSIFGFLIGGKLFPYVIITAYKILYIHIPHVLIPYQWSSGVAATLIAVACTGLATCTACYKELLAQPAVLMRPVAPQIGKRTWIEKIPFLWKRLNFTWKSTLRNLFRYKKRFFMTLLGIGGCMGLLLVGFGLRDSIIRVAEIQYEQLQTYDVSIYLNEDMNQNARQELEAFLSQQEDVSLYTTVHMSSITTQSGKEKVDAYLIVIKDGKVVDEFFSYHDRVSKEKYQITDRGVILSEKTAKMLGVKKGDTMVLSEDGINPKQVKVEHICENYVGHYVYMTDALYQQIYEKEAFGNNILIKSDAKMSDLEALGTEILKFAHVLNVQYTKTLSSQLNDMLGALDRVIGILIIVAGMLSFVVLYNLNNINITERRRELATLKVLGFRSTEVAAYVYRENILLTLLGIIVGCGLGRVLHLYTITTVEIDLAMFGREIAPISYVICAAFTMGFSALVNWMMYFKLKKINMVESLKSVE